MPYLIIYIPCESKQQAQSIANTLLKQHLIACANIIPSTSMYWWDNKITTADEHIIFAKTKQKLYKEIMAQVKQAHTYQCPCIVSWQIQDINKEYKQWLEQQLK